MRFLAFLVGLFLSFATPLFALGATIEPSASDLTVVPGETATATISVKNDADWAKNYEISLVQARFGDQAEDISLTALSATLKGALSATPSEFSLDAHASRTVDVKVRLPLGAEAQSPAVAILVTEKGDREAAGSVQASVASLLFIHVPGNLTRSVAIDSFVALPSFTFGRETMLSGVFSNDGQETVLLPNEVRVFGPLDKEVGRGALSAEPKHLPPGTTRGVTLAWPAQSSFNKFIVGPYRFELWDGDQKLAQTSVTFLPVGFIVAAVVGFIVVLLGIIITVRRRT